MKQALSPERIIDAAIAYADENGLEALSMRKVAERLGVQAMSLYNHVKNKEEMIDGMVGRIVEGIYRPDLDGYWKDEIRKRCLSAYAILMRHSWATQPLVSRVNTQPVVLHYVDATVGCLHKAGFPISVCDHAWNLIDSHLYGFTLQALNFPFESDEYAEVAEGT